MDKQIACLIGCLIAISMLVSGQGEITVHQIHLGKNDYFTIFIADEDDTAVSNSNCQVNLYNLPGNNIFMSNSTMDSIGEGFYSMHTTLPYGNYFAEVTCLGPSTFEAYLGVEIEIAAEYQEGNETTFSDLFDNLITNLQSMFYNTDPSIKEGLSVQPKNFIETIIYAFKGILTFAETVLGLIALAISSIPILFVIFITMGELILIIFALRKEVSAIDKFAVLFKYNVVFFTSVLKVIAYLADFSLKFIFVVLNAIGSITKGIIGAIIAKIASMGII